MKKPTRKYRRWNQIHARLSEKRSLESKRKLKARNRRKSGRRRSTGRVDNRRVVSVECPEIFSLEKNFAAVARVLSRIRFHSRRRRNEGFYLDLRKIRELSPSAALVLAAELDRWNKYRMGRRLKAVDVEEWDSDVHRLLSDMGFFDLLEVPGHRAKAQKSDADIRYVKFRTGAIADGQAIENLREDDLEPMFGPLPGKVFLYNAVTEAMTNVVQHAYHDKKYRRPNWWLSASHGPDGATIMIYDQGAGIPATLPRKFQNQIQMVLRDDHARMIKAAHELSRTRTGESHRGHGLQRDVRGYLRQLSPGYYAVTSLRGKYAFERLPNGSERETLGSLSGSLRGTLIEWKIKNV